MQPSPTWRALRLSWSQRLHRHWPLALLLASLAGSPAMAQVLAMVPQFGLDAVLVAVEVVLEGATPSGAISVEHVRNVLARLNGPALPEHAQTALQLSHVPEANTARYDRLRTVQEAQVRHV